MGSGFPFLLIPLLIFLLSSAPIASKSACRPCSLALSSYYLLPSAGSSPGLNLTYISFLFNKTTVEVLPYNPSIPNENVILAGTRVNIPFPCDCLHGGAFLGRSFSYKTVTVDSYSSIAHTTFVNLTTVASLGAENNFSANQVPSGVDVEVVINCSCGDAALSRDYGLFSTYPLRPGENLTSIAAAIGFQSDEQLLENYNPGVNFSGGQGIVFLPVKDANGSYRPLGSSSAGISGGAIAGISIAVAVILVIGIYAFFVFYKRKKGNAMLLSSTYDDNSWQNENALEAQAARHTSELADLSLDKSVEFTYEELAKATIDFSLTNKIGEGGFGAVYYAELRGEKAAIKKMDMQATKEFLAELKVLTHVHHLNLVRLIGYCIQNSLFLIYEYMENGNLSQHLRGSDRDVLTWPTRVQIALDSARGLEYIHEHTVPVYIHRDIKSANILIDKNFRGKVADFGLTKLNQVGNASAPSNLVGTFGYMPPEYARYGDVSPKVDVYAFGVVLYELVSAKEAVVKTGSLADSTGLVSLFENALSQPDPVESLKALVDPRLKDNYPVDSVLKMVQLARACTDEDPNSRPSMRSVVVHLMTLLSMTEDWDAGNFHGNQAFIQLMSGR